MGDMYMNPAAGNVDVNLVESMGDIYMMNKPGNVDITSVCNNSYMNY
jgi:hypothetical protein